jgi:hypothetical protein
MAALRQLRRVCSVPIVALIVPPSDATNRRSQVAGIGND